jgi:hypothetical protein
VVPVGREREGPSALVAGTRRRGAKGAGQAQYLGRPPPTRFVPDSALEGAGFEPSVPFAWIGEFQISVPNRSSSRRSIGCCALAGLTSFTVFRGGDIDTSDQAERPANGTAALNGTQAATGSQIPWRASDNACQAPYLFQRLNAGGTQANAQELRNCIVIMVNKDYFLLLKRLADLPDFREVISVTDDQIERQRYLELATRFLVHNYIPYDGKLDVEEYIDDGIVAYTR